MIGEAIGRVIGLIIFPFLVMAIVGGLYYLAARPRLTFLQAMFRWWVILVGLLLLVLGVFGQIMGSI